MITKKNNFSADVIRVIAIIGVLLIHLVYPIYARTDFFGGVAWWLATALNSLSRVSIPLFIMLSGYLILPKNESFLKVKKRILHRIFIPLTTWTIFYFWWDKFYLSKHHSFQEIIGMIFMSNIFHLYFLIIMIGLYLLTPFIRRTLIEGSERLFYKVAITSFIVGGLIYLSPYLIIRNQTQFNSFTIWLPYLGYFLLGFLGNKQINGKIAKPAKLAVLSVIYFFLTLSLSYFNVYARSKNVLFFWRDSGVSYFDEYLSPVVIAMSISMFFMIIQNQWINNLGNNKIFRTVIKNIARVSFPMYLSHFVVLNILDFRFRFAIEFFEGGSVMKYFLIRSTLALLGSWALANILVRIPILKKLVGEK